MKTRTIAASILVIFVLGCAKEKVDDFTPRRARKKTKKQAVETEVILSKEAEQAIRITSGDYYDCYPSWSPDGKKIAYASYRQGAQNIWMINVSTKGGKLSHVGKPLRVTTGNFIDQYMCWSPDGETILFSSSRDGGNIFTVKPSDKSIANITEEGIQPQWSPQGDKIAYVHMNNIWTMEMIGEKSKRYLTRSGYNEYPAWSGNGERLVFSSGCDLMVINEDGSMPTPLTSSGLNAQPDWHAEMQKIVFTSNRGGYYDLCRINPDGSDFVQLTDGPGHEHSPRWSPDGKWIAFQADYEGSFDIWVISAK